MPENLSNFNEDSDTSVEELQVSIIDQDLRLYQHVLEILQYRALCFECLGRQYSFLATGTNNSDRANAILLGLTMECHRLLLKNTMTENYTLFNTKPIKILFLLHQKTNFIPAKKLLIKWLNKHPEDKEEIMPHLETESSCFLCNDLLRREKLQEIQKKIEILCKKYDFNNYLVGTYVNTVQANREDEFRSQFHIRNGESIKANLNRVVGKIIGDMWNKPTVFEKPDINIMIDLRNDSIPMIEIQPSSLLVKSRYMKFVRDLPQTHWHCHQCRGRGFDKFSKKTCPNCKGTGDMYSSSVEDLIAGTFLEDSGGIKAILHGAGREDIDARCLGKGRPFIMEIKAPKKRFLNFDSIQAKINSCYGKKIYVSNFSIASKQDVIDFKADSEFNTKKYHALVELSHSISSDEFQNRLIELQQTIEGKIIKQRTPLRVLKRRSDIIREKQIHVITGRYIDPIHCHFSITTQGGTYIKEFISSDNNRTNPSIASIFGIPMVCVELDVVQID